MNETTDRYLYFAYGANLNKSAMKLRCPGAKYIGRAKLAQHHLMFRAKSSGAGVADVVPRDGRAVLGALWELDDDHIRALDRFEGYPYLYTRERVLVTDDRGIDHMTIVYKMTGGHFATPSRFYYSTISEGYIDCGLPGSLLARAYWETEVNEGLNPERRMTCD